MAVTLGITTSILCLEDPSMVKKSPLTKWSESWDALSQEAKEKFYNKGRDFIYGLLPAEWVWKYITKPQAQATGQYYYDILKKSADDAKKTAITAGLWTTGIAAAGATAYGLYQWATRRGLGGIVKDFQDVDREQNDVLRQIDDKKRELQAKKNNNKLLAQDRTFAQNLHTFIASKIKDLQQYIQRLTTKMNELTLFIKKDTSPQTPLIFQRMKSLSSPQPKTPLQSNIKPVSKKDLNPQGYVDLQTKIPSQESL